MKHLLIVTFFIAGLSGTNAFFTTKASAAAVNCSFDACMKICTKNRSTPVGCSGYCTKLIQGRTASGQCKQ